MRHTTSPRTLVSVVLSLQALQAPDLQLASPVPTSRAGVGATIEYTLVRPVSRVVVEIVDARGRLVRSLAGAPHAGRHRVVWDLRYAGPTVIGGGASTDGGAARGPLAVPAQYTVRLVGDSATVSKPLVVEPDPGMGTASAADLEAQLELALQIRDRMSQAAQAVIDIRSLKAQVADRIPKARSPAVGLAAEVVTRRLNQVEEPLLSDAWSVLRRRVEEGQGRPSDEDSRAVTERATEQDTAIDAVRAVVGNEIVAFNRMITNGGLPPLELPATLPSPR